MMYQNSIENYILNYSCYDHKNYLILVRITNKAIISP